MEREQFTFYASFYRAVRRIKKAADRAAAYDVICAYALTGEIPDLDAIPDAAAIAFDLIRPVLDSSKRRAESGKAGGKQTASKPEANDKQTGSKPEANRKRGKTASDIEGEKEGEGEKEIENECYSSPTPSAADYFSGDLLAAVGDWLSYKRERRQSYKPTGLKTLFSQLRKAADQHGDAAVVDVIRNSIASNYAGITLDRLANTAYKPATGNRVVASGWDSGEAQEKQKKNLERLEKYLNDKI